MADYLVSSVQAFPVIEKGINPTVWEQGVIGEVTFPLIGIASSPVSSAIVVDSDSSLTIFPLFSIENEVTIAYSFAGTVSFFGNIPESPSENYGTEGILNSF